MDIGVDITLISRFNDRSEKFINTILTEEERKIYDALKEERKKVFLATRWASKEAIFKATQDRNYLGYSILNEENGKPYVLNHPEIKISISHDGDFVVAFVQLY
ncbi:MAG: holo-ACP synthase [Erysipelotrichaceae bacterium]|nr:holo-ACP synthase [Erysipelotrichaceae bacterium]